MKQGHNMPDGDNALIALGGNSGDARQTILDGLTSLADRFDEIMISHLYQTPAFPIGSGPDFVNAACMIHTDLSAQNVLAVLHEIENIHGRVRTLRWGTRTLDLDLIALGQQILPDITTYKRWKSLPLADQMVETPDTLILPHPRLQDRPFVLIPLADIAPDWRHPHLNRTIAQMVGDITPSERAQIKPL